MKNFLTEQEEFWAGEFGSEYIKRNNGQDILVSYIAMFAKVISRMQTIKSVLEFGSNIGLNLRAIKILLPEVKLSAIEINQDAVKELKSWKEGKVKVYSKSILEFVPDEKRDLTLIAGVLIHVNPDKLQDVYKLLYKSSRKYIFISEYYNPSPIELPYQGHQKKLFKRDFAGEMMDKYPDLKLVDYGFVYHRDPNFPQDDSTWFLLEKSKN